MANILGDITQESGQIGRPATVVSSIQGLASMSTPAPHMSQTVEEGEAQRLELCHSPPISLLLPQVEDVFLGVSQCLHLISWTTPIY